MSRLRTIIEARFIMSIPNIRKREIKPTHPGEMLREDFMPDYKLTVAGLAEALAVSRQTINELLRERRSLSPDMAIRLSRLFGNSPGFWLNAQQAVDLWEAQHNMKATLRRIKPLKVG
jgi:antitoxin HigA-1